MACAPGARHFCDIYAASTTQPTSKAIFTLPKLWPEGAAVFRIWWVQIPSFSRAAMRRQSHRMAMACSSSWTGGREGAMRMLLSWGSTP